MLGRKYRELHSLSLGKFFFPVLCLCSILIAGILPKNVFSIPAISPTEARAFLGGRSAKIVFVKNYNLQMYFVDFADSALVEHKIAPDEYVQSPMISPDGTRIVYESGSTIWIRDLVENSSIRYPIFTRMVKPSQTMEPHWWIDPVTKFEYITYLLGEMQDYAWPPQSSGTMIQRIVNNKPLGEPLLLIPFMMSTGRSHDGRWGGSSHHSTGMYKLQSDSLTKAFLSSKNWLDSGSMLACNGSISPSLDPTRQNRMMHLTSGGTSMGSVPYDNHKAVIIRSWDDKDLSHPFWYMGPPGDKCNNDGNGNLYWGSPEWSTDENYFTATGSRDIDALDTADLYMVRINYTSDSQILRVVKGSGKNLMSHMWIKDGIQPAKLRLNKLSLAFAASKQDSVNPATQTVNVSNAGDGTLPTLKLSALPSWLKVTISGNGTNTPVLTNTVYRDSVKMGDYQAKVNVSFGQFADSLTYTVTFKLSDPVLTRLQPIPANAMLLPGDSVQLRVVALDQTGTPMVVQPTVTWSGSGALKPNPDGFLKADTAVWKTVLAVANAGGLICTTTVSVVNSLLRIDAAGISGKQPMGWQLDGKAVTGGTLINIKDTLVVVSDVVDAAPDSVYRSYRSGPLTYLFDSLPDGRYRVRFHFVSPVDSPSIQTATIMMQGIKVIEGYRPPPKPLKGLQAEVRTASVTVSDGKGLHIGIEGGASALAGMEIFGIGQVPVSLLSPNGGESLSIGDTLHIRWKTDESVNSIGLQISIDSAKTWIPITRTRSVSLQDLNWGDYPWVIPDSLSGKSLLSDKVYVSVYDYFGTDRDKSNQPLTFTGPRVGIKHSRLIRESWAVLENGTLRFRLPDQGTFRCLLMDRRGRLLRDITLEGGRESPLALPGLARGLYTLAIMGSGQIRILNLPFLF